MDEPRETTGNRWKHRNTKIDHDGHVGARQTDRYKNKHTARQGERGNGAWPLSRPQQDSGATTVNEYERKWGKGNGPGRNRRCGGRQEMRAAAVATPQDSVIDGRTTAADRTTENWASKRQTADDNRAKETRPY